MTTSPVETRSVIALMLGYRDVVRAASLLFRDQSRALYRRCNAATPASRRRVDVRGGLECIRDARGFSYHVNGLRRCGRRREEAISRRPGGANRTRHAAALGARKVRPSAASPVAAGAASTMNVRRSSDRRPISTCPPVSRDPTSPGDRHRDDLDTPDRSNGLQSKIHRTLRSKTAARASRNGNADENLAKNQA